MTMRNNMQLRVFIRFISMSVMTAIFLTGCASFNNLTKAGAQVAEVPITENPTGEVYPGKVIWHDLITPDPVAAGQFYEKLFGWQIDYQDEYSVVRNGGKLIAGILKVEPADGETKEGVWIPSISVADVDVATTIAKLKGGKILKAPVDRGEHGRLALISDPQGANLVLMNAKEGDPADAKTEIGGWLWDEVWTYWGMTSYCRMIGMSSLCVIRSGVQGCAMCEIKIIIVCGFQWLGWRTQKKQ